MTGFWMIDSGAGVVSRLLNFSPPCLSFFLSKRWRDGGEFADIGLTWRGSMIESVEHPRSFWRLASHYGAHLTKYSAGQVSHQRISMAAVSIWATGQICACSGVW